MNYSYMSFSTPELSLAEMFEVARKYGYTGIEPRLDVGHKHGVEVAATADERRAIKQQVQESGIKMVCLATSLSYANPDKTEDMISQTHERIDLAGDLDVPAMRVFGGRIPQDNTREQGIELLVSSLGSVADHASKRGVILCVETHDDWCDPANLAEVLKRLDHPAIAANWDIMHPVKTAKVSMDNAFQTLKPWIRHVHVHDGIEDKLVPIGTGVVDHRRAIELLSESSYDGFISGEWINWEPYDVHLPRELATMKRYEQEVSGR